MCCDVLLPLKTSCVAEKRKRYLPDCRALKSQQMVEETHRAASLRAAEKEREETGVREPVTSQSEGHKQSRLTPLSLHRKARTLQREPGLRMWRRGECSEKTAGTFGQVCIVWR